MDFQKMEAAYLERSIFGLLNHPNILKCVKSFEDSQYFCLVTELMHNDLRNYTNKLNHSLDEDCIRLMFVQMLKAVDHCHQHNVIHRDIKQENFLIKFEEDGETVKEVVLTDFGLACIVNEGE